METPSNFITLAEMLGLIEKGDDKPFDGLVLAQIIDIATEYREEIRVEEKATKKKKDNFKVMELAILAAMKKAGTDDSPLLVAGGLHSTATLAKTDVPTVTDWSLVYKWVVENDGFHLLQRRVAAKAWADELKLGDSIPGIDAFATEKISLRKR